MLCLPGIGALGVADDDRLIEPGIEVKCQIRGTAPEIDAEAVGEQKEGQPRRQDRVLEEPRSNTWLCTQFLHQYCRCLMPPVLFILLRNWRSLNSGGLGAPLTLSFLYLATLENHLPLQPTFSPHKSRWFLCTYLSVSSNILPLIFRLCPVFKPRLKISNFS